MKYLLAFIITFAVTQNTFAEITNQKTVSTSKGKAAQEELKGMFDNGGTVYKSSFKNEFGRVVGTSLVKTLESVVVEDSYDKYVANEKVQNCWTLGEKVECETATQTRTEWNDHR